MWKEILAFVMVLIIQTIENSSFLPCVFVGLG